MLYQVTKIYDSIENRLILVIEMKRARYDSSSNLNQEIQSLKEIREIVPDLSITDTLNRFRMLKTKVDSLKGTDVHKLYDLIRESNWYMEAGDGTLYLELDEADTNAISALGLVREDCEYIRFNMATQNSQSILDGIYTLRNFYDTPHMMFIPNRLVNMSISSGYNLPNY